MTTLEATFRIVTPMFLGGAEHEAESIRPPSFKGVLRFWWRALNWGRFYKEKGGDETEALKALHDKEKTLFGSAAEEEGGRQKGGQGCFLMSIKHNSLSTTKKNSVHAQLKPTKTITRNGRQEIDKNHLAAARYLGYGLMVAFGENGGQLEKSCLNAGQPFTVKLLFKDNVDDSIMEAMKTIGLLGGLGSRIRRGMGSIALESLKLDDNEQWKWTKPTTEDIYKQEIRNLFTSIKFPSDEPPFTAFWKDSRIDLLLFGSDQYSVLNDYGKAMLMYRSWGRSNGHGSSTVLGEPSEQHFLNDHHWCKGLLKTSNPNFHPERVMFGLPHNYDGQQLSSVKAENHERRSSPLFFHVHQLANNSFIGVSIYLPSIFLPTGEQIKANGTPVPAIINNWKVLTNFLDGQVGNPPPARGAKQRFPYKKAVLP